MNNCSINLKKSLDENLKSQQNNNELQQKPNSFDQFISYLMTFNEQYENLRRKMPELSNMPFRFNIKESLITALSNKVRDIVANEPNLLRLTAPVYLIGDIHGQFSDLVRFLKLSGLPPKVKLLFLGDYVDRGDNSIEVIALLFSLKIRYPDNVFLIRGNHECSELNKMYGFSGECSERYNKSGNKIWKTINNALHHMSVSVLINDVIFCTHGGISPKLSDLNQINNIKKGINIPNSGIFCDLTWADPKSQSNKWQNSDRGVSYTFNEEALDEFMAHHNLQLICRAHQVVDNGYKFFNGNKLVTIFSAPNYCGEVGNNGAIMYINDNLECSFTVLKPVRKPLRRYNSLSTLPQE